MREASNGRTVTDTDSYAFSFINQSCLREDDRGTQYNMDETLQELIQKVCSGFPTHDVGVSNVFDQRRFAKMAHFAWKHAIGFHPDMFKKALMNTELFHSLQEHEIETKAHELCQQADFARSMFHAAFDLENLTI